MAKFSYLLVLNTFPDKFMSIALRYAPNMNMTAGASVNFGVSLLNVVNPPPIALNATDSVIINSLSWVTMNSTLATFNSSFETKVMAITVINATFFTFRVGVKYPVLFLEYEIKAFIFNKADFAK